MSLADKKIGAWINPVSAETDRPERSAADMKAVFDSNSNQLKAALNGAIDELNSQSGAAQIGVAAVTGITAGNIQEALSALKDYADYVGVAGGTLVSVNGYVGKDIVLDYADVGAAPTVVTAAATLTAQGWAGAEAPYTQTAAITGMTGNTIVDVSPAPESFLAYAKAQVRATAQGAGTLTFACEEKPQAALSVNIKITGVDA